MTLNSIRNFFDVWEDKSEIMSSKKVKICSSVKTINGDQTLLCKSQILLIYHSISEHFIMFFPLKENPWYYADTSISVQEPNMTIFILFFSEEPNWVG